MGRETGGQGKKEKGRVGRQIPRGQGFKKNTHQSWDGESKSGMYMYRDQSRGINLAGHKSGFAVIKQAICHRRNSDPEIGILRMSKTA